MWLSAFFFFLYCGFVQWNVAFSDSIPRCIFIPFLGVFLSPCICMYWNAGDYYPVSVLTCISIWHFTVTLQKQNVHSKTTITTKTNTILILCVHVWLELILTLRSFAKALCNSHALIMNNCRAHFNSYICFYYPGK